MKTLNAIQAQFVAGGFDDKTSEAAEVEMKLDLPSPVYFEEQSNHAEIVEDLIKNSTEV